MGSTWIDGGLEKTMSQGLFNSVADAWKLSIQTHCKLCWKVNSPQKDKEISPMAWQEWGTEAFPEVWVPS